MVHAMLLGVKNLSRGEPWRLHDVTWSRIDRDRMPLSHARSCYGYLALHTRVEAQLLSIPCHQVTIIEVDLIQDDFSIEMNVSRLSAPSRVISINGRRAKYDRHLKRAGGSLQGCTGDLIDERRL